MLNQVQSRKVDMFNRWICALRGHASRYEHTIQCADRVHPTLDDICNEMNAFLAGLED